MSPSMIMALWNMLGDDEKADIAGLASGKLTDFLSSDTTSEDGVEKRMKPYKKGLWKDIAFGIGDTIGDAVQDYYDIKGTKKSLLGDALAAVTGENSLLYSPGFVNPTDGLVKAMAIGKKASGATDVKMGEAINRGLHNMMDPLRERENRLRNIELDIREQPNTGFYDYTRRQQDRIDEGRSKGRDRAK